MLVDSLHKAFQLATSNIDTLDRISFEPYEIDIYLNKAIIQFVKDSYNYRYDRNKGFEVEQSTISKLSSLVIKSPELQPAVTPNNLGNGRYELNLDSLGNNVNGQYFRYMYFISGFANCTYNGCNKRIRIHLTQHDDLISYYNSSSFYWGRVNGQFGKSKTTFTNYGDNTTSINDTLLNLVNNNRYSNDKLSSIYLDTNDVSTKTNFVVNSIEINYLKYPNEVYFGGYQSMNNAIPNTNIKIHSDIDDVFQDEIIRIAVLIAKEDILDDVNMRINSTTNDKFN